MCKKSNKLNAEFKPPINLVVFVFVKIPEICIFHSSEMCRIQTVGWVWQNWEYFLCSAQYAPVLVHRLRHTWRAICAQPITDTTWRHTMNAIALCPIAQNGLLVRARALTPFGAMTANTAFAQATVAKRPVARAGVLIHMGNGRRPIQMGLFAEP